MSEPLDKKWFERLRALSVKNEESDWIQSNARAQTEEREQFFADEIENPRFEYATKNVIQTADTDIEALLSDMQANESDALVLDLYRRKLEKQIVRNNLIRASYAGDDALYFELSKTLYGKPKKKYFSYIAKRLQQLCKEAQDTSASGSRLCKLVSKIDTHNVSIAADMLPPVVADSPEITSMTQVLGIFQDALKQYQLADWSLVVDAAGTRSRFSVNNQLKIVNIPCEQRLLNRPKQLTEIGLEALAAHEVGVHARRSAAGLQSPLQLLGFGLDSYLTGEEGVAGYVQQQVEGATEFYGFDRYLTASLAIGLDGQVRDFRAVFSLMVDYYVVRYAAAAGEHKKAHKEKAQEAAWIICLQIFKGTTGQTAGCIYTKDIVYFEGNIGIWNLLSEKPHVFPYLFTGKFNPLIDRHVKSLQTLEIIKEW